MTQVRILSGLQPNINDPPGTHPKEDMTNKDEIFKKKIMGKHKKFQRLIPS